MTKRHSIITPCDRPVPCGWRHCDTCNDHHSTSCHNRIMLERRITTAILRSIIKAGYAVNVDIGDGYEFKTPTRDFNKAFEMATAGDEARIFLFIEPFKYGHSGWIYLVFGNDGYDLISDYTTNLDALHVLDKGEAIAKPYWDGKKVV